MTDPTAPPNGDVTSLPDAPVDALVAVITAAFADNPPLPRRTLVYAESWETSDLIRNLATVKDVPNDSFIEWHSGSLPVFRPEGLRHVLPFYMIYSVHHPESEVTERLIFHLSPADTSDEYWRERLAVFTPAQKRAICEYMRFTCSKPVNQGYDEYLERALTVWHCA